MGYRLSPLARNRLTEIYRYSVETFGERQADLYLDALFACFGTIAGDRSIWRPIPARYGVAGWFVRCERHFIYFRVLNDGDVGIATLLHERMDVLTRLTHEFGRSNDDDPH